MNTKPTEKEFEIFRQMYRSFQHNLAEVISKFGKIRVHIADSTVTRISDAFEIVYTNGTNEYVLGTERRTVFYMNQLDNFPGNWMQISSLIDQEPQNLRGTKTYYQCIALDKEEPEVKRFYTIPHRRFHGTSVTETKTGSLETRTKSSIFLPNGELAHVRTVYRPKREEHPCRLEFYWRDPITKNELSLTSDTLDSEVSQRSLFSLRDTRLCMPNDFHVGEIEALAYRNGTLLYISSVSEKERFLDQVYQACTKMLNIRREGITF